MNLHSCVLFERFSTTVVPDNNTRKMFLSEHYVSLKRTNHRARCSGAAVFGGQKVVHLRRDLNESRYQDLTKS